MKRRIKILVFFAFFVFLIPSVYAEEPYVEENKCSDVGEMVNAYDGIMDQIESLKCSEIMGNNSSNDFDTIGKCSDLYTKKSYILSKIFKTNETVGVCASARFKEIIKENEEDCSSVLDSSIKTVSENIMNIFYIVAPFLVILFGSLDFAKIVVANNPNDIKKHRKNFVRRLVAMILLFLTPAIIRLIFSFNFSGYSLDGNVYVCKRPFNFSLGHWDVTYVPSVTQTTNKRGSSSTIGITSKGGQRMVDIALQEIGNNSADGSNAKYSEYFNSKTGRHLTKDDAWCAMFVTWVGGQAGYVDSGIFPIYASCDPDKFRAKNAVEHRRESGYKPVAGDVIFYYYDGHYKHTGLVISSDDKKVYTIEGNTNCVGEAAALCHGVYGVSKHEFDLNYYKIWGYFTPQYPE